MLRNIYLKVVMKIRICPLQVYCHWAVYVGQIGDEEHCVVHRSLLLWHWPFMFSKYFWFFSREFFKCRANPTAEGSMNMSSASVGSGGAGEGGR